MRLPLLKGMKIDGDSEWRDSLPVNMVAFEQQVDGDAYYLRTLDGLRDYSTAISVDRGSMWSDRFNIHARVSGDKLISVDQFGAVAELSATTIAGSSQVQFATSFNSIAFIANGEYYRYDPIGLTLTQIAKPVGAGYYTDITWIDGYYVLCDSENLWSTNIADETIISPISSAGSDFTPDDVVAVGKSTDNKLIAFNRYSTERFANNAGPQFPFARLPSAAIPIGIVGPKARVSIGDGTWAVFGGSKENSPTFYLLTNSYQKISTGEIDTIIDGYSDFQLTNIQLEIRDTRDQRLLICHLPSDVLVYDVTLSGIVGQPIWYRWRSEDNPWRGINGVYDPRSVGDSSSAWIYGDKQDGRLGKLDTTICTQYGVDLEWSCSSPLVVVGGTIAYLEVLSTPGHTITGNPKVFISTTRDGVLFGPEVIISAGSVGQYQKRIIALRLGDYPLWFGVKMRGYSSAVTSLAALEIDTRMP
jgi:hypothetical protein